MTKPETKKRLRFLTILLLFAVFAAVTANIAFSEPNTGTNIIISDSIAPMKLEIDSKTDNATETKTVTLTNTGEAANEYILYVEQTGGEKNPGADIELSESKITLLPGNSKTLEIEVPVQAFITNSADAEYKLKIIRNPETQTPVGYIIPITLTNLTDSESDNKTAGGRSGTGTGLMTAEPENEAEIENKNAGKTENNHSNSGTDEKESVNNFMKKSGIILLLVFLILFVSAAGITIQKKKKKGKD